VPDTGTLFVKYISLKYIAEELATYEDTYGGFVPTVVDVAT
jgi:hypothetical protein